MASETIDPIDWSPSDPHRQYPWTPRIARCKRCLQIARLVAATVARTRVPGYVRPTHYLYYHWGYMYRTKLVKFLIRSWELYFFVVMSAWRCTLITTIRIYFSHVYKFAFDIWVKLASSFRHHVLLRWISWSYYATISASSPSSVNLIKVTTHSTIS